jgi:hypothetical protein
VLIKTTWCVETCIEEGLFFSYFNIACVVNGIEINLHYHPYVHWNIYTADAQHLLRDLPEDDNRGVPKHV